MHETWVGKDDYTIELLRKWYELDKKNAIGIFCKTTGALLSSCLRSYAGWIVALQTVESARRKGYGKLLLKKISKNIAQDSVEPGPFTSDWHITAQRIFHNIAFEKIYDYRLLYYSRYDKS